MAGGSATAGHVTRRHPDWVRKYEGKVWLDPGLPEVRDYSMDVIMNVVNRYDIKRFVRQFGFH